MTTANESDTNSWTNSRDLSAVALAKEEATSTPQNHSEQSDPPSPYHALDLQTSDVGRPTSDVSSTALDLQTPEVGHRTPDGSPLTPLTTQLKKLPGIGPKSAQRLAFFLLSLPKQEVQQMAQEMVQTREKIRFCDQCFNISLTQKCYICTDHRRDPTQICVVAEPRDIFAMEKTHEFKGLYHVLGGLISPIDGMHPETLRIKELTERLQQNVIEELIFAINPSIEGDATVLYLSKLLSNHAQTITKLAHGLPMGADIDYTDELTLQKALQGRTQITNNP